MLTIQNDKGNVIFDTRSDNYVEYTRGTLRASDTVLPRDIPSGLRQYCLIFIRPAISAESFYGAHFGVHNLTDDTITPIRLGGKKNADGVVVSYPKVDVDYVIYLPQSKVPQKPAESLYMENSSGVCKLNGAYSYLNITFIGSLAPLPSTTSMYDRYFRFEDPPHNTKKFICLNPLVVYRLKGYYSGVYRQYIDEEIATYVRRDSFSANSFNVRSVISGVSGWGDQIRKDFSSDVTNAFKPLLFADVPW